MALNQRLIITVVPLLVVLFLQLTQTSKATHKIINKATTYPHFQHINVPRAIAAAKLKHHHYNDPTKLDALHHDNSQRTISVIHDDHEVAGNSTRNNPTIKLKLIHRDKLSSTGGHSFTSRIQRDVKRVAAIYRRLSSATTAQDFEASVVESFGSDVVSGMEQGSGEYFVRIGVGSPPRSQYMVVDSGSDIVWVQCQPCNQCYRQTDPVFNPAGSASFSGVSCSSSVCARLESGHSGCHSGRCRYQVLYSDGSYTKGTLAMETLTVGQTTVRNVAMGCGHSNRGMFVGAAGLLGVGGGSMSFVSQLGGQMGGAFGYCLVSRGGSDTGSLVFGRASMPVGAAWIGLIRNPRAPTFYYVGLGGLGVGGSRVAVPNSVFALSEDGDGGVVMDTGTAVTRLPTAAYTALRDEFLAQTTNLPRATGVSIFDTCYDLAEFSSVRVPTVSFYFEDGPTLTLPARNFLIPVDEVGTFCFAFAPSPSSLSIIGNIQQEGIQISIDGANGFVGFGPNTC